jgi:hypothetical protein
MEDQTIRYGGSPEETKSILSNWGGNPVTGTWQQYSCSYLRHCTKEILLGRKTLGWACQQWSNIKLCSEKVLVGRNTFAFTRQNFSYKKPNTEKSLWAGKLHTQGLQQCPRGFELRRTLYGEKLRSRPGKIFLL